jgi:hypothetical protein|tara:strand:- start:307 stop:510 length:204 start_codon:yes stop_codon:yes gene_type:complete
MTLRRKVWVSPISEQSKLTFVQYLNSKNIVRLEHRREDKIFLSSIDNPDFWFWINVNNDSNWEYKEL